MNSDLKELLELLKSHDVRFLVIGSHLLALYARPRFTEDLDLWIERNEDNALKLAAALREFGFPYSDGNARKLVSGRNMLRVGEPPNRVDFLAFLGQVGNEMSFSEAASRAVESELMEVRLKFLSKEDFINSKRAAGRKKDLLDLALLEEADKA
jgi:predicted nucleotidyltransferase